MASFDLWYSTAPVTAERETRAAMLVVPHEQTDLHRVFCDDAYCLDRTAEPESAIDRSASLR